MKTTSVSLGPAKTRVIKEAIIAVLGCADKKYLSMQSDAEAFARSIAWEVCNAGYCTQQEYEDAVLPYLVRQKEYIDILRVKVLQGEELSAGSVALFSVTLKDIGRSIKQAREAMGWTQADLAQNAGTTQALVSRIERGESLKQPSIELLDRLSLALGKRLVLSLADRDAGSLMDQPIVSVKKFAKAAVH